MLTTLDAQPQEWMEGDADVYHTVAACHFKSLEHIEYWVEKLIPKNQNGRFVKWSSNRGSKRHRDEFINNCLKHSNEIDFMVNCISSLEGKMSWFAQAFYMQNNTLITQKIDAKGRNCLVFQISSENSLSFPVLRAGYLIWYHHVIKYLGEFKGITGKFLSDNFCADEVGPGDGKALGVGFVNFLLKPSPLGIQVSLPTNDRYRQCDQLSDYFCGWVNSVRSGVSNEKHQRQLAELESTPNKFMDNIIYEPQFTFIDDDGNDVTQAVMDAVERDGDTPR